MAEIEDSPLNEDLTEEAIKQRNLLIKQKQEEFERKQVQQAKTEIQKSIKKINFNWKIWLIALLVVLCLGLFVYLFDIL
jgi:hypothetical protein